MVPCSKRLWDYYYSWSPQESIWGFKEQLQSAHIDRETRPGMEPMTTIMRPLCTTAIPYMHASTCILHQSTSGGILRVCPRSIRCALHSTSFLYSQKPPHNYSIRAILSKGFRYAISTGIMIWQMVLPVHCNSFTTYNVCGNRAIKSEIAR
jgi:hypothetical protein